MVGLVDKGMLLVKQVRDAAIAEQLRGGPEAAYHLANVCHLLAENNNVLPAKSLRDTLLDTVGWQPQLPNKDYLDPSFDHVERIALDVSKIEPAKTLQEQEARRQEAISFLATLPKPKVEIPKVGRTKDAIAEQIREIIYKDVTKDAELISSWGLKTSDAVELVDTAKELYQQNCLDIYGVSTVGEADAHKNVFWQEITQAFPDLSEEEKRSIEENIWFIETLSDDELEGSDHVARELYRNYLRQLAFEQLIGTTFDNFTSTEKNLVKRIARSQQLSKVHSRIEKGKTNVEAWKNYLSINTGFTEWEQWRDDKSLVSDATKSEIRSNLLRQCFDRGKSEIPSSAEQQESLHLEMGSLKEMVSNTSSSELMQSGKFTTDFQRIKGMRHTREHLINLILKTAENDIDVLAYLSGIETRKITRDYDLCLFKFLVQPGNKSILDECVIPGAKEEVVSILSLNALEQEKEQEKFLSCIDKEKLSKILKNNFVEKNMQVQVNGEAKDIRDCDDVASTSEFLNINPRVLARHNLRDSILGHGHTMFVISDLHSRLGASRTSSIMSELDDTSLLPCFADDSQLQEAIELITEKQKADLFEKMLESSDFFDKTITEFTENVARSSLLKLKQQDTSKITSKRVAEYTRKLKKLQDKYKNREHDSSEAKKYTKELMHLTNEYLYIDVYGSLLQVLNKVDAEILVPILSGKTSVGVRPALGAYMAELHLAIGENVGTDVKIKGMKAVDSVVVSPYAGSGREVDSALTGGGFFGRIQHGLAKKFAKPKHKTNPLRTRAIQASLEAKSSVVDRDVLLPESSTHAKLLSIPDLDVSIVIPDDLSSSDQQIHETYTLGSNKVDEYRVNLFDRETGSFKKSPENVWGVVARMIDETVALTEKKTQMYAVITLQIVHDIVKKIKLPKGCPDDIKKCFAKVNNTFDKWNKFSRKSVEQIELIKRITNDEFKSKDNERR